MTRHGARGVRPNRPARCCLEHAARDSPVRQERKHVLRSSWILPPILFACLRRPGLPSEARRTAAGLHFYFVGIRFIDYLSSKGDIPRSTTESWCWTGTTRFDNFAGVLVPDHYQFA